MHCAWNSAVNVYFWPLNLNLWLLKSNQTQNFVCRTYGASLVNIQSLSVAKSCNRPSCHSVSLFYVTQWPWLWISDLQNPIRPRISNLACWIWCKFCPNVSQYCWEIMSTTIQNRETDGLRDTDMCKRLGSGGIQFLIDVFPTHLIWTPEPKH